MGFAVELNIHNLGLLENSSLSESFASNRTVLFAGNGEGKSTLSRAFRLIETQDFSRAETLITVGKESASCKMTISDNQDGQSVAQAEILIHVSNPSLSSACSNDYIFHVFNSDYVEENLRRSNFVFDGNIKGYILGKENIDVSSQEEELGKLKDEGQALNKKISDKVEEARKNLKDKGVRSNTNEYQNITLDALVELPEDTSSNYEDVLMQYTKLESLDEDAPDIACAPYDFSVLKLNEIERILSTSYTRANFAEDFLNTIKAKLSFVQLGVELFHEDQAVCPFCEQPVVEGSTAKHLIAEYESYLSDEESKTIAKIDELIRLCKLEIRKYGQWRNSLDVNIARFDEMKSAFESCKNVALGSPVSNEEFTATIQAIVDDLENKKSDISKVIGVESVTSCRQSVETASSVISQAINSMQMLDELRRNASSEKRSIRKRLCVETLNDLYVSNSEDIGKLLAVRSKYSELNKEIKRLKNAARTLKKELVADLCEKLIHEFFGDKYLFDKDSFALTYRDKVLSNDTDRFLSDGEKSVIAFCLFVAKSVELLSDEDEVQKLFFVIDDPISSLDYQHVYMLAEIIRNLDGYVRIPDRRFLRYLILTHNFEFFNVLVSNRIASNYLRLADGEFSRMKGAVMLPANEHLVAVYKVAKSLRQPDYSLGNSVRQVIETLWHFERPDALSLLDYIQGIPVLSGNVFINVFCNDQSHGRYRLDIPVKDSDKIRACEVLIDYICENYPGQVAFIEKELSN